MNVKKYHRRTLIYEKGHQHQLATSTLNCIGIHVCSTRATDRTLHGTSHSQHGVMNAVKLKRRLAIAASSPTSASSPPPSAQQPIVVAIPSSQQEAVDTSVQCLVPSLQPHLANLKVAKTAKVRHASLSSWTRLFRRVRQVEHITRIPCGRCLRIFY